MMLVALSFGGGRRRWETVRVISGLLLSVMNEDKMRMHECVLDAEIQGGWTEDFDK